MKKMEGKSLTELIKEGSKSLASMPAAGAAPADASFAGDDKIPAMKEKQEDAAEEGDVDVCDLFGGDDDY